MCLLRGTSLSFKYSLILVLISQVSPCENYGGQSDTGRGFSPSNSVFPCQYHSIIAPYSSSSTCDSYQKDKRAKPGDLPKRNVLSEIGKQWVEKYFHFFFARSFNLLVEYVILTMALYSHTIWQVKCFVHVADFSFDIPKPDSGCSGGKRSNISNKL